MVQLKRELKTKLYEYNLHAEHHTNNGKYIKSNEMKEEQNGMYDSIILSKKKVQ